MSGRLDIDFAKLDALAVEAVDTGAMSSELVDMLYKIARRAWDPRRHTSQLVERDDAVQEALLDCFKASSKFNPKRGNAYAFYRTIIRNSYGRLVNAALRQRRTPDGSVVRFDQLPAEVRAGVERDLRVGYLHQKSDECAERKAARREASKEARRAARRRKAS